MCLKCPLVVCSIMYHCCPVCMYCMYMCVCTYVYVCIIMSVLYCEELLDTSIHIYESLYLSFVYTAPCKIVHLIRISNKNHIFYRVKFLTNGEYLLKIK